METVSPHGDTIRVGCCPKEAPGPSCGKPASRKDVHNRLVRTIASKRVVFLDVTYAEYRARCGCCTTSRTTPPGVEPRATYATKVRPAVLDRILDDGRSVERVIDSMRRDFLLDLPLGSVYDGLHHAVQRLDIADHRRWVLERFSGTVGVDELHLGRYTLLWATDPLQDLPVAFALVSSNDQGPMQRSLKHLKTWGLGPEVVVADGSNLSPTVLAELWSQARHQWCAFHVLKDLHQQVLDAERRLRRGLARRGDRGRERKRGRPRHTRRERRGLTNKEKAAFLFQHRYLITRRRDRLSRQERTDLGTMLSYLPELKTLRPFVDRLQALGAEDQSASLAWRRRRALVTNAESLAMPELATALERVAAEKFTKMIAFLKGPACRRVRTNNHVERINRKLRPQEEARSPWRSRRTLVRFMGLPWDRSWTQERANRNRWPEDSPPEESSRSVPRTATAQGRQVA